MFKEVLHGNLLPQDNVSRCISFAFYIFIFYITSSFRNHKGRNENKPDTCLNKNNEHNLDGKCCYIHESGGKIQKYGFAGCMNRRHIH